jgi:hypothetical protein
MDFETNPAPQTARPYFIPSSVDFSALPAGVQMALTEIVAPTYDRLVLRAASSLERSAGVTLTFLLTLEILDQFQLGRQFDLGLTSKNAEPEERSKLIARHLRLITSKQTQVDFLMRLQTARARFGHMSYT